MSSLLPEIPVNTYITLTTLHESDFEDLIMQISDPYIHANTLTVPHPYTLEHAKAYLTHIREFETANSMRKDWMIKFNNRVIGGIGLLYNYGTESLNSEIGYWLGKGYRGRGLMTMIISAFVDYLFTETRLQKLEAQVFPENKASVRVLQKCGFTRMNNSVCTIKKNGETKEIILFVRKKNQLPLQSYN